MGKLTILVDVNWFDPGFNSAPDRVNEIDNIQTFLNTPCEPQNRPPTADAGPDQIIEWATSGTSVTLDGSGSTDPDGDSLTFTWTGPFAEGGGTATGISPTVTLPSLGSFDITLIVNDGTVDSDPDTVTITLEDTTSPEPTAALIPAAPPCNNHDDGCEDDDDDNDGGSLFQVEYSCIDTCDTNPQVAGVIKTPSLDGLEVKLKTKSKVKLEFDLEDGEVEIQAPDPGALLSQLQEFGGLLVDSGQLVEVEFQDDEDEEEQRFKFDRDGVLKIEASSVMLAVICEDSSGNQATATATLTFDEDKDD